MKSLSTVLRIVLLLAGSLLAGRGYAQAGEADCIRRMQTQFDRGNLRTVLRQLPRCLRTGDLSREKRAEAWLLLAKTYAFLDHHQRAGSAMEEVFRANPRYVANPIREPAELVLLAERYRVAPWISLGVRGGSNLSEVEVLRHYSVGDQAQPTGQYTRLPGWNAALTLDFRLVRGLYLSAELQVSGKQFAFAEDPLPATRVSYREQLRYLEVPLSLKYEFGRGRVVPFLRLGGSGGYLIDATKTDLLTTVRAERATTEFEGPDLNVRGQRRTQEWNALAGLGLMLRRGFDRLVLEVRYRRGLDAIVRPDARFGLPQSQYFYYQVDDDFRLHNYEVSLGFLHRFWKIRLRKRT
ncbi:MAG: porin family protein [Bacteroidota bacterium]